MVLVKSELIGLLKHEVRILVHLAGKLDRSMLDYRPTPKQRSALELLQYLSIMGPELVEAGKQGTFDTARWRAAEAAAKSRDFEQTLAVIDSHKDTYAQQLGAMTDDGGHRCPGGGDPVSPEATTRFAVASTLLKKSPGVGECECASSGRGRYPSYQAHGWSAVRCSTCQSISPSTSSLLAAPSASSRSSRLPTTC